MLSAKERARLSPEAAEHFEAELFAQKNPDFYPCPHNARVMLEYMEARQIPPTIKGFEQAFVALKRQNKIMPGAIALEQMSAEEIKDLSEKIGAPVKDFAGRIIGYDLPPGLSQRSDSDKIPRIFSGAEGQDYYAWCEKNNLDPEK